MQCSVTILDQSVVQNNELGLKFHSLLEMWFHPLTHNTQHVELKTALSKHFDFIILIVKVVVLVVVKVTKMSFVVMMSSRVLFEPSWAIGSRVKTFLQTCFKA